MAGCALARSQEAGRLLPVGFADSEPVVHVLAVRTGVRELLEALAALERLLAGVQPLVLGQVVLMFERLWALQALVWTLACQMKLIFLLFFVSRFNGNKSIIKSKH